MSLVDIIHSHFESQWMLTCNTPSSSIHRAAATTQHFKTPADRWSVACSVAPIHTQVVCLYCAAASSVRRALVQCCSACAIASSKQTTAQHCNKSLVHFISSTRQQHTQRSSASLSDINVVRQSNHSKQRRNHHFRKHVTRRTVSCDNINVTVSRFLFVAYFAVTVSVPHVDPIAAKVANLCKAL